MRFVFISILLMLTSCSLNADQEAALHEAKTRYVNARNDGDVMTYVALTHPNAVAYYKERGDSIFTQKFDLTNSEFMPFLQDGNILQIKSKEQNYQVKYSFLSINDPFYDSETQEVMLFALSEDDGVSWFFLDEDDYFNNSILPQKVRLIE